MKLTEFKTGDKIEMRIIKDYGDKKTPYLKSQFESAEDENVAIIAAPIYEGIIYPVHTGEMIYAYAVISNMFYRFKAKVIGRNVVKDIATLKIELNGDIEKAQRRQYYRLDISIPVKYRLVNFADICSNPEKIWQTTTTRDISACGINLLSNEKLQANDIIDGELYLSVDRPIKFRGVLVRAGKFSGNSSKYKYEAGVFIEKIDKNDREAIVRFIFNEQRKLRKRGLL